MGLAGLGALGVKSPLTTKTGLVFIETDGCFADGIRVATGATVGHRHLGCRTWGKLLPSLAKQRVYSESVKTLQVKTLQERPRGWGKNRLATTTKVGWSTMIPHSKYRPDAVRFYNKYR